MHSFVLMICKVQCNIPVLYSRNCVRMWICTWHGSGCQEAISFCRHLSKCMYAILGSRRVCRVHDKTNSRLWSNAERGPRSAYTFSSSSPRTCIPNSKYSHGLCPAHCRHCFLSLWSRIHKHFHSLSPSTLTTATWSSSLRWYSCVGSRVGGRVFCVQNFCHLKCVRRCLHVVWMRCLCLIDIIASVDT